MRERATELEYLEWFRHNADFGPADSDVKDMMNRDFMDETGKNLPKGWNYARTARQAWTGNKEGIMAFVFNLPLAARPDGGVELLRSVTFHEAGRGQAVRPPPDHHGDGVFVGGGPPIPNSHETVRVIVTRVSAGRAIHRSTGMAAHTPGGRGYESCMVQRGVVPEGRRRSPRAHPQRRGCLAPCPVHAAGDLQHVRSV